MSDCPATPLPYPLDVATFRTIFTAFADPTAFPDPYIQAWLDLACNMVNPCAWGEFAGFGQGLWAAHEMAKFGMAAKQAQGGNLSGIGGIVQSKSVGPASVSYDTTLGSEGEGAGNYNLTIYGRQYYHLARLFGMGPIQVGAISWPGGPAPAWPGPLPYINPANA